MLDATTDAPDPATPADPPAPLGRAHARRLLEIELLAAGLLQRVAGPSGHETLRVTDAGVACLAAALVRNRAALSAHEALVERVACEMARAGRITWRALSLRAQ